MGARKDWDRNTIDFDDRGQLVIKNAALAEEIRVMRREKQRLILVTPPKPQPQPNLCGCMYTVTDAKPPRRRRPNLPPPGPTP